MQQGLEDDRESFFDQFMTDFFSAGGQLKVTEEQREDAIGLCHQADQTAALGCIEAFGTTDFRGDLLKIALPTLVIHGDSDGLCRSKVRESARMRQSGLAIWWCSTSEMHRSLGGATSGPLLSTTRGILTRKRRCP
ncbi:MAG: alpha/beta hydrolase [Aeromicrobium sp.]|jgi:pimeloyl-ACP methyl ester carboxylesterase|nr:alpha/beta hydrolase [Aeromicrobium sp.]